MRYDNVNSKKTDTGKTVLEMKIFPTIPKRDDDIYIVTQETDRLDLLAYDFYQDSTLWWVIASANALPGDSMYPPVGIQLRIPVDLQTILNSYNSSNNG